MSYMVWDSYISKLNGMGLWGSTMHADNINWTDGTKIRNAASKGRDNENKWK